MRLECFKMPWWVGLVLGHHLGQVLLLFVSKRGVDESRHLRGQLVVEYAPVRPITVQLQQTGHSLVKHAKPRPNQNLFLFLIYLFFLT